MLADTLSGKDFALKVGPITDVEMSDTTFVTRSVSASMVGRFGTTDVNMDTMSVAFLRAKALFVTDAFVIIVEWLVSCAYPIGRVVNIAVKSREKMSWIRGQLNTQQSFMSQLTANSRLIFRRSPNVVLSTF